MKIADGSRRTVKRWNSQVSGQAHALNTFSFAHDIYLKDECPGSEKLDRPDKLGELEDLQQLDNLTFCSVRRSSHLPRLTLTSHSENRLNE